MPAMSSSRRNWLWGGSYWFVKNKKKSQQAAVSEMKLHCTLCIYYMVVVSYFPYNSVTGVPLIIQSLKLLVTNWSRYWWRIHCRREFVKSLGCVFPPPPRTFLSVDFTSFFLHRDYLTHMSGDLKSWEEKPNQPNQLKCYLSPRTQFFLDGWVFLWISTSVAQPCSQLSSDLLLVRLLQNRDSNCGKIQHWHHSMSWGSLSHVRFRKQQYK